MTVDQARIQLGARLCRERETRKWGKRQMARELLKAIGAPPTRKRIDSLQRQMLDWEAGKHWPRDWSSAYATAFGLDENELFGAWLAVPDTAPVSVERTIPPDDWDEMERRQLLLAALGAGAIAAGEPVRQLLDLLVNSEVRPVEEWGLACTDHLHALRTQPPAQVSAGLAVDLLALQRQLRTASAKEAPELHRVAAALAILHANALTRLGDHGAAIRWARSAKAAADASGDLDVRLMVRCEEAGYGLYGQRDLHTVLRLIEEARAIAADGPTFWPADLAGTEAKALSLLGRHDAAQRALSTFVHWEGEDGRAGIIPSLWSFDQAHFAESWVYSRAGDEKAAGLARESVLSNPAVDYQYAANVQLHSAICTVAQGGVVEGMREAATVLDALPPAHRSRMITETGRTVLQAVPLNQRQQPAGRQLRELLALTAPSA